MHINRKERNKSGHEKTMIHKMTIHKMRKNNREHNRNQVEFKENQKRFP